MLKIYYKICVDFIVKSKENNNQWKFPMIMYLSAFLSLILMSIFIIFEKINTNIRLVHFDIGNFEIMYKSKLFAILMFFIPSILINYFLVFYKNRYEILLQNYKSSNGKLIIKFMLLSISLVLICIFIWMIMATYCIISLFVWILILIIFLNSKSINFFKNFKEKNYYSKFNFIRVFVMIILALIWILTLIIDCITNENYKWTIAICICEITTQPPPPGQVLTL